MDGSDFPAQAPRGEVKVGEIAGPVRDPLGEVEEKARYADRAMVDALLGSAGGAQTPALAGVVSPLAALHCWAPEKRMQKMGPNGRLKNQHH